MVRCLRTVLFALSGLVVAGAVAPAAADSGDLAFDAGLQWGLERIGTEAAWKVSRGAGVTIAVVDSGVALDHEDLASKLVEGTSCRETGGDPAACGGSPQDDDGHGTHVAGIAAAVTGNGVGIAGTAPDARILPIKVLFRACPTCSSSGSAADVVAAVRWAADHGADVINLSLGSTTSNVFGPGFADAVTYAWERGSIPVIAAGNDDVRTAELGQAPAVMVSATDRDDGAPDFTASTVSVARWAVAAPGGDGDDSPATCSQHGAPRGILSTYWAPDDPTSAYACLSGTSMAAPHVSGALALLLAHGHTPESAVRHLLATAVDLGSPGTDPVFGAGRIDLAAALSTPPAGSPPASTAIVDGPVTPATSSSTAAAVEAAPAPQSGPQRFVTESTARPLSPMTWVAVAAAVASGTATVVVRRRLSAS